ncbi:MAG: pentapeptide repeat-containing protein [Romboutsia sp.]
MTINKKSEDKFNYNNVQKLNKNFMYMDFRRSNCYNSDFSGSNFNFTSLRGAHFKSCNFYGCSFKSAEFIATNLKKSKFRKAKFENTIFDSVNLDGVDFNGATFENVIFLKTDLSKAINLNYLDSKVKVFNEMPKLEVSERLETALKLAMTNKFIKASRTLDTKDRDINNISLMILLENFKEKDLVDGLNVMSDKLDKEFSTLSYIIKTLKNYQSQGLM